MRKPDPARFTGKREPDELEMKGFSVPLSDEAEAEQAQRKPPTPPRTTKAKREKKKQPTKKPTATTKPGDRDTTTPRDHDTTVSWYHDTIVEVIRRAVKEIGKEAATHRFTAEEKKAIADLIYTYKNEGVRTSENEIARIAVNFVVQDYKENGKNSILDKVLRALNE